MITVHGRANSSNVQKVVWALNELGLDHERIDRGGAFGGLDDPEFRAISPFGQIPVLVEDGLAVTESNTILRHLGRRPDAEPFWPRDAEGLARAEAAMDWAIATLWPAIRPPFVAVARAGEPRSSEAVGRQVAALAGPLSRLEGILARRPWLSGDAFGFGDIPAAVAMTRLTWLVGERAMPPGTRRWLADCADRPGWEGTVYVDEEPR